MRGLWILVVACALVFAADAAWADTIDFNGLAPAGSLTTEDNATTTFGDYKLTPVHAHFMDPGWIAANTTFGIVSTSDFLYEDSSKFHGFTITRTDGGAFSLVSLDAADSTGGITGNNSFTISGTLAGGGTVSTTFSTASRAIDVASAWETFSLGGGDWNNLTSVTIDRTDGFGAWDNIKLSGANPVPEPGTLMLVGLGVAGLISRRKRKTAE